MAFQGSLKELPLPDIIQLMSVSGKTGVFTLQNRDTQGEIYLQNGQIVHAQVGDLAGEEAVYELAIWPQGEFVFSPDEPSPQSTIEKSNTNLLMEAARRMDEWQVLSKKIPSTRHVPVFAPHSTATSVSFTPQEWEVIRTIDERRSIEEIGVGLGHSPFETCKVLYGLITSGLVQLKESLNALPTERLSSLPSEKLSGMTDLIHSHAQQLLSGHARSEEVESAYRLSRAEIDANRGVDAVLDLIRSDEKIVSAALGPHQAKAFLGRIQKILASA